MKVHRTCSRTVRRIALTLNILSVVAIAPGGLAHAGGPFPCYDVQPCIRVAPDGSIPFEGVIRDDSCAPIGGATVRLVFSQACENLRLCPDPGTPPVFVIETATTADGSFRFEPPAGGCCQRSGAVTVGVDPGDVVIAHFEHVGSPDNGGDGVADADLRVNLPDFSRFSAAFLTSNPCFDYTVLNPAAEDYCDERVRLADFTIFSSYFASSCE